ncbi:MAG: hypothetical protein U9Q71_07210 [Pseudomonadota bacterium]|nr:hypothetical protein [Pseudomonadota bacterium]
MRQSHVADVRRGCFVPEGLIRRIALRMFFIILAVCGTAEAGALLPAQRSTYYQNLYARPLEERILPAPAAILELTHLGNRRAGVDLRPTAAAADHPLAPLVRAMIRSLPAPIYRLASRHLAGVFLVDRTFGSARAEGLWNPSDRLVGGYMVLNVTALARPANAWAGMRENSAFHSRGNVTIEVILEPPATDTPESALRFIFLHELGHVLGMGLGLHGHWAAPETFPLTLHSPFARLSWQPDGHGGLVSPAKQAFPLLTQLHFYRFEAAPLPRSAAPRVYGQLARTDFPSLYGVLSAYEDFAEIFALYVHTRILDKPYAVVVQDGGRVIGIYRSCLQTGSCPAKAAFVERLLYLSRTGWCL